MIWLNILLVFVWSTVFTGIMLYFCDDSCLPYKRKMEKMFNEIVSYQTKHETCGIEFTHKDKKFNVGVRWDGDVYKYGHYAVYINGKQIITWHVLHHVFTNSRLEEHHGDMKQSEELEILQAAYKYAKKANSEWWDAKLSKPSYFD